MAGEWHSHGRFGAWERRDALKRAKLVRKKHPDYKVRVRRDDPFIHVEASKPYDWKEDNY